MPLSPSFAYTRPEVLLSVARNARERAEEVLARAESFHDADAREMMHRIAWSYEKLARRLEQYAHSVGPSVEPSHAQAGHAGARRAVNPVLCLPAHPPH